MNLFSIIFQIYLEHANVIEHFCSRKTHLVCRW